MSDTDSLDFLQEEFDPNSLTVPRLRSILVHYDVSYPSTAKKAQLIKIFIDEILPQRRRILKERDRARRSSRGIVNATSPESLEIDEDIAPLPRVSRKSKRSTSSRLSFDEESEEGTSYRKERTQSLLKKTPRANSKHARSSDTENGLDVGTRRKSLRTRKSESMTKHQPELAKIRYAHEDDAIKTEKIDRKDSAFTYDNPFQSGSSPLSGKSLEMGRKSLGTPKERRRASGYVKARRRETTQIYDGIHPPSSNTFESPISPSAFNTSNGVTKSDEIKIEPSEEFTLEEQLELARERAAKGVEPCDPPRKSSASNYKSINKGPLWVVMITILICYAAWYREQKIAVGYCGIGRESKLLTSSTWNMPNWARILLEPECEPCPYHAYCSDRMKVQCELDFLQKPHPLSFFSLIPLVPTCEPDGEKVRRIKVIADRAVEELREKRMKFECGATKNEAGAARPAADIDANDLMNEISKKRRGKISNEEFQGLWPQVLEEIKSRDEVQSIADGIHTRLSSTSLARLPLSCALRRSVRKTMGQYRIQIGFLIIIILALLYVRSALISRRKTKAIIPSLVSLTLERLTNQAITHQENSKIERWISIGQLRDDILRDEHSIAKRERVWRKVRIVIETNANVRSSQKEDRNGEVSRVWEWIGAIESRPGLIH
ncbi:Inner nuclear membrane protein SRC1 [Golovinomyces cichoracearum]|uniref:Inner nuclear membrane protein SRC1 n=1 Tax=Golovinomyces cichoracearum TaxID=62708 RepID=A0A420IBC0_9PEZI|nr:Inner nuclear membrane protein SRC1 [Golovinomyces cichoracearum]